MRDMLHYPKFQMGIVKDFTLGFIKRHPQVKQEQLTVALDLRKTVHVITNIFLKEATRGHVFYDTLFLSLLSKQELPASFYMEDRRIASFFAHKSAFQDMDWDFIYKYTTYHVKAYLLCYDFCSDMLRHYDELINDLYVISCISSLSSKQEIYRAQSATEILTNAIQSHADELIRTMERKGQLPYVHTSNNLDEILARLPKQPELPQSLSYKPIVSIDDDIRIDVTGPAKGKKTEPKSEPTTIFDNPSSRPKGFAALAGMTELKEKFRSDIIDVIREPERARALNITLPNGALLYGPPGCGKTFFAEKLADEAGCNFILVNCSDIASSFIHGTQKLIAEKFAEAEENKPSIIFFDEIDAMIPKRNARGSEYTKTEVNEFLTQLNHCGRKGIIAIGATNRPQDVDEAALRSGRLELKYYLPQPDKETRTVMFGINLNHTSFRGSIDLDKLADMTEDYVSADIERIVAETKRAAFRKKLDYITMDMLEETIRTTKPSVTKDTIKECEAIRDKFEGRKPEYQRIGFC